MATAKTQPQATRVDDHLAAKATPAQRADCEPLMALLQQVTGEQPVMWGPSIVGYGRYQYRYDSGRTGESCLTGFAIRGKEFVVYLVSEAPEQAALLARLGPHKLGKACLYFKRMADVDVQVLRELVAASVAETRRRHP